MDVFHIVLGIVLVQASGTGGSHCYADEARFITGLDGSTECVQINYNAACGPNDDYVANYKDHGNCFMKEARPNPCDGGTCGCFDDVCKCAEGYTISDDQLWCLREVDYQQRCDDDATTCTTADASCVSGYCDCASDEVWDKDSDGCFAVVGMDDACTKKIQCPYASSLCKSSVCSCLDDWIQDDDDEACYPERKFSETCIKTAQCTDTTGAVCASDRCGCLGGHIRDSESDSCVKELGMGDECAETAQCTVTPHAVCRPTEQDPATKKCQCDDYWILDTEGDVDFCTPLKYLAYACNKDLECHVEKGDVECDSTTNRCQCKDTFVPYTDSSGNEHCLKEAAYEGSCERDVQCITKKAYCTADGQGGYKCQCYMGYVYDGDNDECLPMVAFGGGCLIDDQCVDGVTGAECVDNICDCTGTEMNLDGECAEEVSVDGSCDRTAECAIINGDCESQTCACPDVNGCVGYYDEDTNTCGTSADLHHVCVDDFADDQCTTGSCSDGRCYCADGSFYAGSACVSPVEYGDDCSELSQCDYDGAADCSTKCGCAENHYYNAIDKKCYFKNCQRSVFLDSGYGPIYAEVGTGFHLPFTYICDEIITTSNDFTMISLNVYMDVKEIGVFEAGVPIYTCNGVDCTGQLIAVEGPFYSIVSHVEYSTGTQFWYQTFKGKSGELRLNGTVYNVHMSAGTVVILMMLKQCQSSSNTLDQEETPTIGVSSGSKLFAYGIMISHLIYHVPLVPA